MDERLTKEEEEKINSCMVPDAIKLAWDHYKTDIPGASLHTLRHYLATGEVLDLSGIAATAKEDILKYR